MTTNITKKHINTNNDKFQIENENKQKQTQTERRQKKKLNAERNQTDQGCTHTDRQQTKHRWVTYRRRKERRQHIDKAQP